MIVEDQQAVGRQVRDQGADGFGSQVRLGIGEEAKGRYEIELPVFENIFFCNY